MQLAKRFGLLLIPVLFFVVGCKKEAPPSDPTEATKNNPGALKMGPGAPTPVIPAE